MRQVVAKNILDKSSNIYQLFQQLTMNADRVFFAGLPGAGKSLMLQQLTLMAQEVGRTVHHLQWDTTRPAFETPEILAKYPEIDGVTHAMIRKAIGLWARQGFAEWDRTYDTPEHMLIGEVPLGGNRLMELVRSIDDDIEATLQDEKTKFVIPVPSKTVRDVIETSREKTITQPRHEKETKDAPPIVMRALWHDLYQLAGKLGLTDVQAESIPYSPDIYRGVYQYLLQHRNVQTLEIDEVLKPAESAYAMDTVVHELRATPEQVIDILTHLEREFTVEQIQADVENWYMV